MKVKNTELRIYFPKRVHPAFKTHIGKLVTVRWSHPFFNAAGHDPRGNPLWTIWWFGYVAELDRQIPEDELLPLLTPLDEGP